MCGQIFVWDIYYTIKNNFLFYFDIIRKSLNLHPQLKIVNAKVASRPEASGGSRASSARGG